MKSSCWLIAAAAAALALAPGCTGRPSASDVDLAGAQIVLPDNPEKWERLAAEDAAAAFSRLCGQKSEIVCESAATNAAAARVYVGRTRAAERAGVDAARLSEQEFRVKTLPGAVIVAGGRSTGTAYGVNDLLASRFGVYVLDAGVDVVPSNPHPRLSVGLDYAKKPAIHFRDVYRRFDHSGTATAEAKAEFARFRRRNYLGYVFAELPPDCRPTTRLNASHTFHQLVPPAKFAQSHPEWFSLTKAGKRTFARFGGQLCLTNPEMRREAARRLLEIIAEDRRKAGAAALPGLYEVSQSDASADYLCACSTCQARAAELGGENGVMLDFVNELAGTVAAKYPDVSLRTFAYECTEQPSKVFPVPNVIVRYCDFYSRHVDLYPLEDAVNAKQLALYESWLARKCRLELWDYLLYNFSSGQMKYEPGLPATSIDAVVADVRLFARTGLERIFVEAEYARRYPKSFRKLEYFLLAQLLFDPAQDAEKLVDVFVKGYYGAAAREMAAYLELLRAVQRTHRTSLAAWKTLDFAHLTPDFVAAADDLLARAFAQVKDDPALAARVADEYVSVLRAKRQLAAGRRGREREFLRTEETFRQMDDVRARAAAWLTKAGREAFAAALKAEHDVFGAKNFGDLPNGLEGVSEANLLGVPSICQTLYGNGKIEKDPDSAMPTSIFWQPPENASKFRHGLPYTVGAWSAGEKGMSCALRIRDVPADGRYHWYRVGTLPLRRRAYAYLSPDWRQRFELGDFFLPAAPGEDVNNVVEVWLSMKFKGPAYVTGSTDPNEVATDRVLLVRK